MNTVEEILAEERKGILFDPRKLSDFLYGKEYAKVLISTLQRNPVPQHDFNVFNRGRVQVIKASIRTFPTIYNQIMDQGLTDENTAYLILSEVSQMPGGIHIGMFMKCIEILGTDRQRQQYLKKSQAFEIVGCYAQTQMAHGSDVSSLMTTATFDKEKDQFIIDTPNIKATKFWPGDMGIYSTHALIFAQLIIDNKNKGVHSFIVPIRDKDLKLLPGVDAGDIGPKFGFHSKDNGYLILNKVRIPRENMLRRFISVTKEGKIKAKGDPKVSYATMMEIRRHISCAWPKAYTQAITIATRYSMFRRQFKDAAKQEIKVIDYQLQQDKILQRVAEYYAVTTAGNKVKQISLKNVENVMQKEDFSLMAETHACLSLAKPYFSQIVCDGMEICRRACGGHGFSLYSGLPSLVHEYAANLTLEGENTVLYLQVARYLLKCFKHYKMKKKQIGETVKYIESMDYLLSKKVEADEPSKWTLEDIRVIIAQAVCYLLNSTTEKLLNKEEGFSDKDAWNYSAGIRLKQLAMTHAAYFTFVYNKQAVDQETDQKIKEMTHDLCMLFGIGLLHSGAINSCILEGGFVTGDQINSILQLKESLLKKLRPDLIGLVDGFGIPEKYFRSALISGNPYENYIKLARENDLNKSRLQSVDIVKHITKEMRNPNPSL